MGAGAMNLPEGFVIDGAPDQVQGMPEGFVLDAPVSPSPVEQALKPITSYPETYHQMRGEAEDQMARGAGQLKNAAQNYAPADLLKGIANTGMGAIGYVASPVNAALRTFVGNPIQENAGVPREYSELAASLAIPGMGMTRVNTVAKGAPAVLTPGQEVAAAASRLGVDVPRAVTTDSMAAQRAAATVRNVPLAGDPLVQATQRATAQLSDKVDDIARGYGSGSVFEAGDTALTSIKNWITGTSAATSKKFYDRVDALVNNSITTPLSNTRQAASDIMSRRQNANITGRSKAVQTIEDAVAAPGMNYEGIKDLRTYIRELKDNPSLLPADISGSELNKIYTALSKDLRASVRASGGQKAELAFERANRHYDLVSRRREALAKTIGVNGNVPAEAVFERLLAKAGSTSTADISSLMQARKAIGADDWNEFVSGVVARMGRNPTTRGAPEALQTVDFSPERFLTAYSKLSDAGRAALFRSGGKSSLANQLDDIAAVSTRFKELQKFSNPSGTTQNMAGIGVGLGAMAEPITAISAVVGGRAAAMILSKPATAASAAQFARKYEIALRSPSPTTVAGLTIAARNLSNTLKDIGVVAHPQDFLRAIQGPVKAPAENE
jgi:hypothetical protein